jgi:bacterioferritin
MKNEVVSTERLNLLNQALVRELHVCIQYMLQHGVGAGQALASAGTTPSTAQSKFVASHSSYFLPGATLKKIAIAEMRHAEAIAERITLLGGEPITDPGRVTLGKTTQEMLENDREQERGAIELYGRIVEFASKEHDTVTAKLFQRILSDEEKHHQTFSDLLAKA